MRADLRDAGRALPRLLVLLVLGAFAYRLGAMPVMLCLLSAYVVGYLAGIEDERRTLAERVSAFYDRFQRYMHRVMWGSDEDIVPRDADEEVIEHLIDHFLDLAEERARLMPAPESSTPEESESGPRTRTPGS